MEKVAWKPGTVLYPVPAVMVSCRGRDGRANIVTVSWTGTVCTEPAMTYISLRPSRLSHEIISDTGEFVINLTTRRLAAATDFCGVRSGREVDKFAHLGLTPLDATHVSAPLIAESPVNIECRVTRVIPLGSHDMFLGEVLGVHADRQYFDARGAFHFQSADPLCYSHGKYYVLGKQVGKFGFSVEKKTAASRPSARRAKDKKPSKKKR